MKTDKYRELRTALSNVLPGPWQTSRWGDGTSGPHVKNVVCGRDELVIASDVLNAEADYIAAANPAVIAELLKDHDRRNSIRVEVPDGLSGEALETLRRTMQSATSSVAEIVRRLDEAKAENAALLDSLREARETLEMIECADWRTWEELAAPEEFVRWAKSRCRHALTRMNTERKFKCKRI